MKYSFFHFQITKNCNCQLTFLKKLFTSNVEHKPHENVYVAGNKIFFLRCYHLIVFLSMMPGVTFDEIDQLNYLYSIFYFDF